MANSLDKLNVSIVYRIGNGYTSESLFKSGQVEPSVVLVSAAEELARLAALSGLGDVFLEAVNNQIKAVVKADEEDE